MITTRPFQRLEILSRSESGLHFVRDRNGNILRQLTEEELRDFASDPKPCDECGEQFGCDHYNIAGERLLSDVEIDTDVPLEWRVFARDAGISRKDLERLTTIARDGEEYHAHADADMRTLELALLLNDAR
jgi:hypothetical protein